MGATMVILIAIPSAASGVRRVRVSLPLVPDLIDRQKYFRPDDLPPPAGEELRPMCRPRITKAPRAPLPAPAAARGLAPPDNGRAEDELADQLDRLLAQD